jgi:membrane-bound serine protease (ClpP class)
LRSLILKLAGILLLAQMAFSAPPAVAVSVDGVITPVTVEILSRGIDQARREHAAFLLVRLNTPGGLMTAMRECVEKIIASPVPVVTYVTPSGGRAASAGFFLLEAGDVAAMAPGTNTGAASPVILGQQMDPVMRKKVENDAAASLRSLTTRRSRNSALAEQAVFDAKSFTEREALDNHLIDIIAAGDTDLLRQLNGQEVTRVNGAKQKLETQSVTIVEFDKSTRENILSAISNPNVALALLVIGALCLYVEFSSPGLVLPGVAGAIMALLGLTALSVFPINWLGAALMLLALILFVLEAKITSHGVLGIGGAVSLTLGALLLIDSPVPEVRIRLSVALGLAIPFALITTFLVTAIVRSRASKVETGAEGMLGEIGSARTALNPAGKVFVHGEFWDAISSEPAEAGARVRVVALEGLRLKVEPVSPSMPEG